MVRTTSTSGIQFDEDIPESCLKWMTNPEISEYEVEDIRCYPNAKNCVVSDTISGGDNNIKLPFTPVNALAFRDLITRGMGGFKKAFMPMILSVGIDITRLSSEGQPTMGIDLKSPVYTVPQQQYISVSISPDLQMCQEDLHHSSLESPCGFILSWLEMFGDTSNERES